MGFNQNGNTVVHRFPVATPLMSRTQNSLLSAPLSPFLVNCFMERSKDGRVFVIKRPGYSLSYTYNGGSACNGQGMTYYNSSLYAMGSNTLYRLTGTGANAYSIGAGWTQYTNATWTARDNAACVVFQNKIFIIGGNTAGFTNYFSDVWSSSDGSTWQQLVAVAPWAKRTFFQAVVFNNKLFVMGGRDATTQYNDVWSSDNGVDWVQLTDSAAWPARVSFGLVAFNNGMFLMGGDSGGLPVNDVWFSTDGITWDEVTSSANWIARSSFSCITYAEAMWVIGGYGSGASQNDVWKSVDGKNWTQTTGAAFSAGRHSMVSFEYAGLMWVIAGFKSSTGSYSSDVYKSDTSGGAWTLVNSAPGFSNRGNAMGCVFKAPTSISGTNAPVMWFMGGITIAPAVQNDVWYSNADGSLSSSWVLSTSGATTEQFQFATINANQYLCLKNSYSLWYLYANQLTKVTDVNYPPNTVPGLVNLNSTLYVMDAAGVIYGSNLLDPTTWGSLNFLTAEYESDAGVRLAKLQNYVVALKANTTQFFYDSGQYPGTSLRPVQNANLRIGCASAGSVVAMDNTLIYMAQTFQAGRSIVSLNGMSPIKISNPNVDRLLDNDNLSSVYSYSFKTDGHDFYVLTLASSNVTLVYDLVEKEWHLMYSGAYSRFRCNNYATDGSTAYLQDETVGKVYSLSPYTYTDDGSLIYVDMLGDLVDFQSGQYKFCSRLQLVGDLYASTNPIIVKWTDDNYRTFSTGSSVDLANARPKIDRLGRFARRAHYLTHRYDMPLRLEAIELTIEPGDV